MAMKKNSKPAKAAKPARITAAGKVRTKSEVFSTIADHTGIPRKQVATVFDVLGNLIAADIKSKPGIFAVPGLMKITCITKPATKEREGINPFTKERMIFKAKPARKVVKIRPLKNLKSMVS